MKLKLFWVSAASSMFLVSAIRVVVNSGVVGILYFFLRAVLFATVRTFKFAVVKL